MNDGNGKKGNGPRLGIVTNRSPSVLRGLQAVLFVMRASILDDEGLQILAFVVETGPASAARIAVASESSAMSEVISSDA